MLALRSCLGSEPRSIIILGRGSGIKRATGVLPHGSITPQQHSFRFPLPPFCPFYFRVPFYKSRMTGGSVQGTLGYVVEARSIAVLPCQ